MKKLRLTVALLMFVLCLCATSFALADDAGGTDWYWLSSDEKYSNFYIRLKEEVYDENYEEGRIISQTVEAGSTVPQNTPIGVVVSKGSKMRTVPNIIGKTVSEASKELESAGLALGDQAEEYSDDVESGKIIRLNGIEPGKKIQAGSMINVVVSLGPED